MVFQCSCGWGRFGRFEKFRGGGVSQARFQGDIFGVGRFQREIALVVGTTPIIHQSPGKFYMFHLSLPNRYHAAPGIPPPSPATMPAGLMPYAAYTMRRVIPTLAFFRTYLRYLTVTINRRVSVDTEALPWEDGAMDDITYAYAALDGLSASGDRVRLAYTLNGRGRKLDPMSAGDARIALDALIDTASVLNLPLPTSITVYRVEDAMGVLY